jgi:glycosyltransferase involved in cell wall biosynthesis
MSIITETRQWSETTEVAELQSIGVGIMPLMDSPWERGKCGLKLIQYMAAARPTIGSPVGVNKEIIDEGVTGFKASSQADWISGFTTLQKDPARAEAMGLAAREKVERLYSLARTAPRMIELFKEIALS